MKEGALQKALSKSKLFLLFCCSFLIGVAAQSFSVSVYSVLLGLSFLVVYCFWRKLHRRVVACLVMSCLFGLIRMTLAEPDCTHLTNICFFDNRVVVAEGLIVREPDRQIRNPRYSINVDKIEGKETVVGKILLMTKNYPAYNYGDRLRFECRLRRPASGPDQNFYYDKYLAKDGIFITCQFPKSLQKIGQQDSGVGYIYKFKDLVADRVNLLWPEPESSFMAGILYGSRSGLPPDIKDAFAKTGIAHIVAVSGYNISVVTKLFLLLLLFVGLWRRQSFWVTLGALASFTLFTGASASVVRAAFMGGIVLVGEYIGRPSSIGTSLVVAATSMVALNPYILVWDIGFQLSFIATAGLVYISPFLKNKLGKIATIPFIGEVLIATLAAEVATLPLILYYFGQLSLVAPFVNLLVLWVIPWLMLGGFVAILASWLWYPLGQVLAWMAEIGLKYVLVVVKWFGEQSWSATPLTISGVFMVIWYLFMVISFIYGQKKSKIA